LEMFGREKHYIRDAIDLSGWYLLQDGFEVAVKIMTNQP
jgi:hypothetical protein